MRREKPCFYKESSVAISRSFEVECHPTANWHLFQGHVKQPRAPTDKTLRTIALLVLKACCSLIEIIFLAFLRSLQITGKLSF